MAQDPDGDLVSSYLINRSPRPPPMDNVENATHAPGEVRGLVLRVDGWGEQQPITLRFYKDRTETIHIGRKSAQNPGKYVSTEDRALFQCAVVSRQHAKLTFTEGNVFITDLGSHHGTHLTMSGETASKGLLPEIPHIITEGDTITFGKGVAREDSQVQPIVAHVQLEFAAPPALLTPVSQPAESTEQASSSSKPTSGRYGVYVSSSASSSSDDSDNDSVVFLHSSPPTRDFNCLPSFQSLRSANFSLESIRPSTNLRGVLPPIHTLSSAPSSRSSSVMEISPTDEHFPEYPPLPIVGAVLDATRPGSDPPVIGAWPKSPIDLCSVSPPPFPRGSVDDNSSASSEDGAASHASSDEDIDEDNHEDNLDDDEVIVAEDKPAEASGSDEHPPSLPNVAEVEVAKDSVEEPIEKELESNTNEPMSDVNNAPSEGVAATQDIVVDEVSVEEQVPSSEVPLPENPKSDDVESLKASVSAIAELRRKAEEDLAAIKAAHAEYEQTIAKMKVTSPSTPSPMKRKRTIEFDEADVCTIGVGSSELDLQLPPGVHAEVGRLVRVPQAAPPAKRRRVMRFMTAVAQTTAIATVGAVAAWSALAFT